MVCVLCGLSRFNPYPIYYYGGEIGKFARNILKQQAMFYLF